MLAVIVAAGPCVHAVTTLDAANRFAYGANIGWVDGYADGANGAVVGEYVCSGYLYGANIGWINLGNGNPTNGIYYQNLSAEDFGVNQDGAGNLRGYAWGANIGWIRFEELGAPKVDLRTGNLSGHIYSANCGWLSLTNGFAQMQTERIAPGSREASGLPLAWQLLHFGQTGVSADADADGDGVSNLLEYLAGTNPKDPSSRLIITSHAFTAEGNSESVAWQSVPNGFYYLQTSVDLASTAVWSDSGLGLIASDGIISARTIPATNGAIRFYRVQAVRPLGP